MGLFISPFSYNLFIIVLYHIIEFLVFFYTKTTFSSLRRSSTILINFIMPHGLWRKQVVLAQVFCIRDEHSVILRRLARSGLLPCHIQRPLTDLWMLYLRKESRYYASIVNSLIYFFVILSLLFFAYPKIEAE